MSVEYSVSTRTGDNGDPALVVTIRREREIVLDATQIDLLERLVTRSEAVRDRRDVQAWTSIIEELRQLYENVAQIDPERRIRVETPWARAPEADIDRLFAAYAQSASPDVSIYIGGTFPNNTLVFASRTSSVSYGFSPAEAAKIEEAVATFGRVEAEQRAQGTPADVARDLAIDAATLISSALGCAGAIAAAETGVGIGVAIVTCGGLAATIARMSRAADEAAKKAERELMDRIERSRASDIPTHEWDNAERLSRTA